MEFFIFLLQFEDYLVKFFIFLSVLIEFHFEFFVLSADSKSNVSAIGILVFPDKQLSFFFLQCVLKHFNLFLGGLKLFFILQCFK